MFHFRGNIEAKIDAKGRLFIPAQFRKQLDACSEENIVMKKFDFQDCLTLYPESVWNAALNKLTEKVNPWSERGQKLMRTFMDKVETLTPDSSGRILIPQRYLQRAEIQSEVLCNGLHTKIEIWAKEKWGESMMDPEDFARELELLDI